MDKIIKSLISVSTGIEKAQLVFKDINVINVFTGEIIKSDVALYEGYIAGLGRYTGEKEISMEGKYLCPGFIDAHIHLESSMVTPGEFAKGAVIRGTTGIIADPHEIANVKGILGIEYILTASKDLPLDVYIMLPSCIPATPFENSGSNLKAEDLAKLIHHPKVVGLGEMMNFEGVISADDIVIDKINMARKAGKPIDGHAPNLSDKRLNAYVAAGIKTDHECVTSQEAIEKLRLGMHILIREGSAAKNLIDLLPAINDHSKSRCMFCTDDRHPEDILNEGHIDNNIRTAINNGIDPVTAIQMATINVANCYKLDRVGGIAPGYVADLVVLDDLKGFNVLQVYKNGQLVADSGHPLFDTRPIDDTNMRDSIKFHKLSQNSFSLNLSGIQHRVIGLIPHSLITKNLVTEVRDVAGKYFTVDGEKLLKIAVIERHKETGNIGVGLISGFGLKNGAIASSIAHDSHNVVVIGDDDKDMLIAAEKLKDIGGGVALVSEGRIIDYISMPIAGLMSDQPLAKVHKSLSSFIAAAHKMGVERHFDPIMTLSFMALPVIPELKITDMGLFDVNRFHFTDINVP
jgi:adenine deaminase